MKSYLCRSCGEATLVGTPRGVIRRAAAESVKLERGFLRRLLTGRRERREREAEAADAFLTVPFRYPFLPTACPHCGHRGPRRLRGREPWWEPGLAYRD